MLRRLAKITSAILHPSAIPIYLVALLLFADTIYDVFPLKVKFYLLWVVTLYAMVIPFVGRALLRRADKWGRGRIRGLCCWAPAAICSAQLR